MEYRSSAYCIDRTAPCSRMPSARMEISCQPSSPVSLLSSMQYPILGWYPPALRRHFGTPYFCLSWIGRWGHWPPIRGTCVVVSPWAWHSPSKQVLVTREKGECQLLPYLSPRQNKIKYALTFLRHPSRKFSAWTIESDTVV